MVWPGFQFTRGVFPELFLKRQELVQDIALDDSRPTNQFVQKSVIGVPGHDFFKLGLQLFRAFIRIEMPPFASSALQYIMVDNGYGVWWEYWRNILS